MYNKNSILSHSFHVLLMVIYHFSLVHFVVVVVALLIRHVLDRRSRSRHDDGFDEIRNDAHVFLRRIIRFVILHRTKGCRPNHRSVLSRRVVLSSLQFEIHAQLVRDKDIELGGQAQESLLHGCCVNCIPCIKEIVRESIQ